jgi:hypothetical protein
MEGCRWTALLPHSQHLEGYHSKRSPVPSSAHCSLHSQLKPCTQSYKETSHLQYQENTVLRIPLHSSLMCRNRINHQKTANHPHLAQRTNDPFCRVSTPPTDNISTLAPSKPNCLLILQSQCVSFALHRSQPKLIFPVSSPSYSSTDIHSSRLEPCSRDLLILRTPRRSQTTSAVRGRRHGHS